MADERRGTSRDLSRRGGADVAADPTIGAGRSASTLDGSFGSSVDRQWQTWEQIPVEVRVVLDHHGCSPSEAFVSGAIPPRTRRRGAEVFQRASGWAVDPARLILLDAVRGLEPVEPDRFRPNTPWRLTVRIRPYVGQVKKRSGTVPVDALPGVSPPPASGDDLDVPDVVSVLPAPVRKQVVTTVRSPEIAEDYLFQGLLKGIPRDHEAGLLRATSQTMIAVLATRSILVAKRTTPHDAEVALAGTSWDVRTLTAQLGGEQMVELTSYTENKVIAANTPPQLPHAEPD